MLTRDIRRCRPRIYLDEIICETARASIILAAQKQLRLEIPDVAEMPFRGDEGPLRQMLSNVLDNAIKYTPQHGSVPHCS